MAFATHLSTETQAKVTSGLLLNKSIRLFLVFILFAQWCAVKWKSLSHVWLFATPWTPVCQGPLPMGFYRPEYWSSCHSLLQGILQPRDWTWVSCTAGRFFTIWATREAQCLITGSPGRKNALVCSIFLSCGGNTPTVTDFRPPTWQQRWAELRQELRMAQDPASQMQSRPTGQRCKKKKKSGSDALGMVDYLLFFSITCFIAGAYSVTFNNGRG